MSGAALVLTGTGALVLADALTLTLALVLRLKARSWIAADVVVLEMRLIAG